MTEKNFQDSNKGEVVITYISEDSGLSHLWSILPNSNLAPLKYAEKLPKRLKGKMFIETTDKPATMKDEKGINCFFCKRDRDFARQN